jgi:hypothetical protein
MDECAYSSVKLVEAGLIFNDTTEEKCRSGTAVIWQSHLRNCSGWLRVSSPDRTGNSTQDLDPVSPRSELARKSWQPTINSVAFLVGIIDDVKRQWKSGAPDLWLIEFRISICAFPSLLDDTLRPYTIPFAIQIFCTGLLVRGLS